ncbi:MAG: hypothetical protein AAF658_04875, partial [Myxococcota bacterium]
GFELVAASQTYFPPRQLTVRLDPLDDEVWGWDGTAWNSTNRPETPPASCGTGLAFDEMNQELVHRRGCSFSCVEEFACNPVASQAAWIFSDGEWSSRVGATFPTIRGSIDGIWDAVGNRVLFGQGSAANFDIWNGSQWSGTVSGPPRVGTSLNTTQLSLAPSARFASLESVEGLSEFFVFDGAVWANPCDAVSCTNEPTDVFDPGIVYDPIRQTVVLAANDSAPAATTWIFDGSDWTVMPDDGPRTGRGARMSFDPGRELAFAVGGTLIPPQIFGGQVIPPCDPGGDSFCEALWAWDGTAWNETEIADRFGQGTPASRSHHSFAWDPNEDATLLFGGETSQGLSQETWLLHGGAEGRPAHVFHVELQGDAEAIGAGLESLELVWCGTGTAGLAFELWLGDRFEPLRGTTAAEVPGQSGCVMWRSTSDSSVQARLRDSLVGGREIFAVATSAEANGTSLTGARIETRYVELRVRYDSLP